MWPRQLIFGHTPTKEFPKGPKWKKAMNEDMQTLQKNGTWELAPLPKGKCIVGFKCVFTDKVMLNRKIQYKVSSKMVY